MNRIIFARGVVNHPSSSPSLLARVVHDLTVLLPKKRVLEDKYLVDVETVESLILAAKDHPNFDPDLNVAGSHFDAQDD